MNVSLNELNIYLDFNFKTYTFAPILLQQVLGVVLNEAAATQLPVSRVSC